MTELTQLTAAEYEARFRDSMSAGADAAAAAMNRLAAASENVDQQNRRADTSFKQLEAKLDAGARLAQAKARADETLSRQTQTLTIALERGQIAQDRYNTLLAAAGQRRDDYIAGVERQILAERNKVQALREAEEATRRALETEQRVAAHVARIRAEDAAARQPALIQAAVNRYAGVAAPMGDDDRARRAADLEAYGRKLDELRAKYVPLAAVELARQRQLEGIAEAERLGAITAREAAAARANLAAATDRNAASLRGYSAATETTVANTRDMRGALQQVGYQVGDLFTQISMGQNGLLAFGVQASQFVSFFGAGGALAGAGIVIAVVVAQMLGLADASKALNDAIKAQDELYRAATEAAERYRAGLQQEAETILNLTSLYGSYSEARRRVEEFRLIDRQAALESEQRALAERSQRLQGLDSLPRVAETVARMQAQRGHPFGEGLQQNIREAVAAVMELRAQGSASSEVLSTYAFRLQEAAAIAGDNLAPALLAAARQVRDLIPDADRLERSLAQNALQQDALARSTTGAGAALQGAAGAAGRLAAELRRVMEIAAANPALAVQQEAVALQQRLDALRRGGIGAEEAEARAQEDNRRVTEAMTRAYDDQLRRLQDLGRTREQAEEGARAAAAEVGQETMRRNELARTLEAERKAREEAARAAERGGREAEQRAERERREAQQREERERREIEQQAERARREDQQEQERNARRLDRTVERWGDSLADTTFRALEEGTSRGQGFFAALASGFGSLLRRAAAEALSLMVFQPAVRSLLGGIGFTGAESGAGSMLGSLGSMFSFGGGLSNLLGFNPMEALGLSGGISGLMATPIFGSGALASATNAALGGMGGMFGPAAPSALGAAGLTIGQLLGPAALGALGGGLLANFTGGNQLGGSIGGGLGAAAGFLIGGPIGALAGGALGGGLGGLFGNSGQGFSGGDALLGRTDDGRLTVTGYAGKNFADSAQLLAAAQQQVDALNARLAAADVFFATGMRANVGGGGSPNPTTVAGALDKFGFGLSSNDPRIAAALAPYGGNIEGALEIAEQAKAVITALDGLKNPTDSFAASMKALDDQFRPLWESTVKLGFGFQEVNVAWTKAQQDLYDQRHRTWSAWMQGVNLRDMRASGRTGAALYAEFDQRAAAELEQVRAQLEALGYDASIVARDLETLRGVQAKEREEIALRLQAETDALTQSIRLRALRAEGRTGEAEQFEFEYRATTEVETLRKQLAALGFDAATTTSAIQQLVAIQAMEREEMIRTRNEQTQALTENMRVRRLRAEGRTEDADRYEFDIRTAAEVNTLREQLTALGFDAATTTSAVQELVAIQALERAALLQTGSVAGEVLRGLGQDINAYLERLRTTDAGGYSIPEQLAAARTIFDRSLASAQLNDPEALRRITGDADALLGAARGMYASGQGFTAIRDYVTDTLSELEAARVARAANQPQPATGADIEELLAGYREENAQLREEVRQMQVILADIAATNRQMLNREPPTPVGQRA